MIISVSSNIVGGMNKVITTDTILPVWILASGVWNGSGTWNGSAIWSSI